MFKNAYYLSVLIKTRFLKKLLLKFNNNFNNNFFDIFFNEVEIIFKLPSILDNKHRFILMLMLLEKYLNNKVVFLLDTKTFSVSRSIKIGCIIHLKMEMLIYLINICSLHSIPKCYDDVVVFDISKSNDVIYNIKKILSNTIFNLDKDINKFYDYLSEFDYTINLLFRTKINNNFINKLLLNIFGFYFFNNGLIQYVHLYNNNILNILLEETYDENVFLNNKLIIDFDIEMIEDIDTDDKLEMDIYYFLLYNDVWLNEINNLEYLLNNNKR